MRAPCPFRRLTRVPMGRHFQYNRTLRNERAMASGRRLARAHNILGIFSIGPNPAACLLQGGQLVAMAEEERFVRLKEIELALPDHALRYCLDQGGIRLEDVDSIAYAWDARRYPWSMSLANVRRWLNYN